MSESIETLSYNIKQQSQQHARVHGTYGSDGRISAHSARPQNFDKDSDQATHDIDGRVTGQVRRTHSEPKTQPIRQTATQQIKGAAPRGTTHDVNVGGTIAHIASAKQIRPTTQHMAAMASKAPTQQGPQNFDKDSDQATHDIDGRVTDQLKRTHSKPKHRQSDKL